MDYRVCWDIDIEADSPIEAAREAKRIMEDSESIAHVYRVIALAPDKTETWVDLD